MIGGENFGRNESYRLLADIYQGTQSWYQLMRGHAAVLDKLEAETSR